MNVPTIHTRIWVAVDELACSADALGIAGRLASASSIELAGLFVEDTDLVRLASWPAATETGIFDRSVRPLAAGQLEQALGAQAAALRRRLDVLGRSLGVRTSFRTARGRLVDEVLALSHSQDWIALAGASMRLRLGLRADRARPVRNAVLWLLPEHADALERLLDAASRIGASQSTARPVVHLVLPEDRARAGEIRDRLAALRVPAAPILASHADLAARAGAQPGEMLLATRGGVLIDRARAERLLRSGLGPLLLV